MCENNTYVIARLWEVMRECRRMSGNILTNKTLLFTLILFSLLFSTRASAQTLLVDPAGNGGFESGSSFAANGWTVVNDNTNDWYVGTAISYQGGTSAYVSTDPLLNLYDNSANRTVHFYRDITIPAGEQRIDLSFYLKGIGEEFYDRLLVYYAPTSVAPTAGIPAQWNTDIAGATLIYEQPYVMASYTYQEVRLPEALAGSTVRLIFTWQNDNNTGVNPPASIDNIRLTSANVSEQLVSSSGNYTVPAGINEIIVECWGGGGGGNNGGGSREGGGGGAYATSVLSVTPGASYSYIIGSGGSSGNGGSNTIFGSNIVVAAGGDSGGSFTGGQASSCIPLQGAYSGGDGGASSGSAGGGGGGSAFPYAAGGNGEDGINNSAGGNGGSGYGNGGKGGLTTIDAFDGNTPGGGGGGKGNSSNSGDGADGQIRISWYNVVPGCATINTPSDAAINYPIDGALSWYSSLGATNYQLNFGTNNPPTNIENGADLGNVTSYAPSFLLPYTTYYWQVVPENSVGSASGCQIWSFATSSAYCSFTVEDGVAPITLVDFAGINNASSESTSSLQNEDYTSSVTVVEIEKGIGYGITINGNTGGNNACYYTVYFDWNQDGSFNESDEKFEIGNITNSTGLDGATALATVNVPLGASTGITRMRVVGWFNQYSTTACSNTETNSYGQAEDYLVDVTDECPVSKYSVNGGGTYCSNESGISVGLDNSENGVNYALFLNGSNTGTTVLGDGNSINFGLQTVAGTYTVVGTNLGLGCSISMNGSASVQITTAPTAPVIGTITQPGCSATVGSVDLSGLPTSSDWQITQSPGGDVYSGSGATTTINNLNPQTYTFTIASEATNISCPGSGTGLTADYYNTIDLSGSPVLSRVDAIVNYNWGTSAPDPSVNADIFSVRWSGQILPCYTETYTFRTYSDDGIRLWVNGTQVIDNWTDHGPTYNTGTIDLTAGTKYNIVLEFYENGGGALAGLEWSSASLSQEIVPQSQLFPDNSFDLGCTSLSSADVVIDVPISSPLAPTSITVDRNNLCTDDAGSVTLSVVGGSGEIVRWFTGSCGGTDIGTGTSISLPSPVTTTTYYARWENACGNSTCASVNVIVNVLPSVTASADKTVICLGDNVTLSGGGAASYTWDNGVSDGVAFIPAATTTFTVAGTDANTCQNTAQITITVKDEINSTESTDTTICNGGTATIGVKVVSNEKSAYFNGIDGEITMANNSQINTSVVNNRTVAFWFKVDETSARQVLFEEGGGVNGFSVFVEANSIHVHAWESNTTWGDVATAIVADTWYHIAFVFDSGAADGEYFKGYLNGNYFDGNDNANATNGLSSHSGDITIGASGGGLRYPDGNSSTTRFNSNSYFDEFKLWNRSLTAGELQTEMYNVNDGTGSGANLVVYYNFNNDAATDLAGTAGSNNGTVNGGVTFENIHPFSPTIIWTPGALTADTITVSPTSNTTYTYLLTDPISGCTENGSIDVNVSTLVVPSLSVSSPVCPGQDAVFTVTGTNGDVVSYDGDKTGDVVIGAGGGQITIPNVTSDVTINLSNVDNGLCSQALTGISEIVEVEDNDPPVIPILVDVTGECSATALAPTTTDLCVGLILGTTTDPLTYTAQGIHVITWTFNDGNGNSSTATQNVIVDDVTVPIFDAASLAVITAECEVTSLTPPTATDNCTGTLSATHDATLPITIQGTTTLTWTYDDGNGNTSIQAQDVVIDDITKPIITCFNDTTFVTETGLCGANIILPTASASDNCLDGITITNDFNSGSTDVSGFYSVGVTTIIFNVTDDAGNQNTCSVNVTVLEENNLPLAVYFSRSASLIREGESIDFLAYASHQVQSHEWIFAGGTPATSTSQDPTVTYSTAGTYDVTLKVTDACSNEETITRSIQVTSNPVVIAVGDYDFVVPLCVTEITVKAWGAGGAGGGSTNASGFQGRGGAGGGGGAYAESTFAVTPGATLSVIVGEGGTGVSGTDGNDGGSSTIAGFEGSILAAGGKGGVANVTGGQPSGGAGGTLVDSEGGLEAGQDGENGDTGFLINSGAGGAGGNGGAGGISLGGFATANGNSGLEEGGGGSGARTSVTGGARVGGEGANGRIIITYIENTPPSITSHPSTGGETLCPGAGASTLSVSASGDAPLTYQWFSNTNASNSGGTEISGETGFTYTPSTADLGTLYYYCEVSGTCEPIAVSNVCGAITVEDIENPTVTYCPPNIDEFVDAGTCGAIVSYSEPVFADNCDGSALSGSRVSGPASGSTFPLGETTIVYEYTDLVGNGPVACTFTVIVVDNEDPTINCPADIDVDNTPGQNGAVVNYITPVGTDNCSGVTTAQTAGLPTGNLFPIGTTINTFEVTDGSGNTSECSFSVVVNDNEAPTITCANDTTLDALAGFCYVLDVELNQPEVIDNGRVLLIMNSPTPPGREDLISNDAPDTFFVGETIVTWTVVDEAGNEAECTQSVTVLDQEDPTFTCPANQTVSLNVNCNLVVPDLISGISDAFDNCGSVTLTQSPVVGALLNSGHGNIHTVSITADDGNGNTSSCDIILTGDDATAPVPDDASLADITKECAVTSLIPPTATDNCVGTVSGSSNIPLPISSSVTITWTYDDGNGNTSIQTQEVVISGIPAPTGITVSNSPICSGATVTLSVDDPGTGYITDWFTVSCGGTLVGTGNTIDVTPTLTSTYYARAKNTATNCVSATCAQVTVNVIGPAVTLGAMPSICVNVDEAFIPVLNSSGNPTHYSITYDQDAIDEGFQNITNWTIDDPNQLKTVIPNGGYGVAPDTYNGVLTVKTYSPIECESEISYPVSVTIENPDEEVSVSISASANPVCEGESVVYTATVDNPIVSIEYQWKVNGINVGNNQNTYTYIPANGDVVTCSASTLQPCAAVLTPLAGAITMVVDPLPTISLNSTEDQTCYGDNSALIEYSGTTGSPNKYNIDFDATAEAQGFVDVTNASLVGGVINLVVPVDAVPNTYNAVLSVVNDSNNCVSVEYAITIVINALPNTGEIIPD